MEVELFFFGGGQKPLRNLLVSEAMFFLATFSPSGTALNFLLCARPAAYVRMFWKALSQTSSWNVWKVAPQHLAVDSEQEVGRPLKRSRWEVCFGCLIIRTRWGGLQKTKEKKKVSGQHFPTTGSLIDFSGLHIVSIKSPPPWLLIRFVLLVWSTFKQSDIGFSTKKFNGFLINNYSWRNKK